MVNDQELIYDAKFHVGQKGFTFESEVMEKITTAGPPKVFTIIPTVLTGATFVMEIWKEGDFANKQTITGAEITSREDSSETPSRWFVKYKQATANASPWTSEGEWLIRPVVTISGEIIIYEPTKITIGL